MSAALSMLQMEQNASTEVDQAERHFSEMQHLMQQVTSDTLDRKAYIFSQEATLERKQAAALRRQALEISRRECLRDTWVAHTGNVQASLFVATVLIGFGYELLSGAIVSSEWQANNPGAIFCFFATSMLSIALGMICVSLLLVRYRRLSQFDFDTPWREYSCGHAHPEMVEYIECLCRSLEKWGHYTLVASVTAGSAAIMIYSVDKFQNNPGGGEAGKSYVDLFLNNSIIVNSSSPSSVEITAAVSPIRSIGAPFVFCFIVGVSIVGLVVLDFSLLSSDTLQERPEYDKTTLGAPSVPASGAPSPSRATHQDDDVGGGGADVSSVMAVASP